VISFDGNGGGIVQPPLCVQGNNPRAFSFMIQTMNGGCNAIISTGIQQQYSKFNIAVNYVGTRNNIQVDMHDAAFWPTSGKAVDDGLWHTVLVTYDGTTMNIYVDGILDNTATISNGWNTQSFSSLMNTVGNKNYLGCYQDGSCKFIGKLKNVVFYDYSIQSSYVLANSYQLAGNEIYNSGI